MALSELNLGLAFAAGILSFLSPCVLPLIPSYLSIVAGTSFEELAQSQVPRFTAFINTLFFVIGFSLVFIIFGAFLTTAFGLLSRVGQYINIVAGLIIILLGFNFIFDFWKFISAEKRFQMKGKPTGKWGSLLFGAAFGAGWSPCIGPILSSILLLAGTTGKLTQGLILLTTYSLGLGIPFLLAGAFFSTAVKQIAKLRPHMKTIKIVSGVFLILIGALILLGRFQRINGFLFSLSYQLETWQQMAPMGPRLLFGFLFLGVSLLISVLYLLRIRRVSRGGERIQQISLVSPVRIIFIVLFLLVALLIFSGVLSLSSLLSVWFQFQGI